jgi:hypothetical protein
LTNPINYASGGFIDLGVVFHYDFVVLVSGLPTLFWFSLTILLNGYLYVFPMWASNWHVSIMTGLSAVFTGLLFLLPYLLWAYGRIEVYNTAKTLSLILTAGGIATSFAVLLQFLNNSSEKTEAPL